MDILEWEKDEICLMIETHSTIVPRHIFVVGLYRAEGLARLQAYSIVCSGSSSHARAGQ